MNKTLLIMRNELRVTLRRRSFLILAFGLPIVSAVILLAVILINNNAGESEPEPEQATFTEGYVDPAHQLAWLPANIPPGWLEQFPDEASAATALEAGDIRSYYVIGSDYAETGHYDYYVNEFGPFSENSGNPRGIEMLLLANLLDNPTLSQRVWQPLNVTVTDLERADESLELGPGTDSDNFLVEMFPTLMTLILYMVILIPAGMLVTAITDEKKNRIMEVLMVSITPKQLLNGKFIALAILGLVQAAMWMSVMWIVTRLGGQAFSIPEGFEVPLDLLFWAIIFFLGGYAMYGALMAGLGALAPDAKETRGASFMIMLPIIGAYMFMFLIFEVPNGVIAVALSLFPLTAPVAMISRMTVTDVPLWQLVLSATLQAATAIFILRAVARMFRAQALLSGQPVKAKQYLIALFGRA
ncbi:MAG: ABC transporter permease [Anaerolineae bacterium]|nr:ABC transporter permease [Anaerolineae bacterium]MCO5187964.1 ABC transporter permease [Anaerolineae bacterium]MCO5195305.1 ABC transporter permease [Anaerolineae bacterium]MCO5198646.1 ABC transporter permease [Anaerolineae bacterium]MCO5207552.1 ABC transporter permease [Anaerolineae bacterium]